MRCFSKMTTAPSASPLPTVGGLEAHPWPAKNRTGLFISHARPEDNAFTVWLLVKLGAAGNDANH